MYTQMTTKYVLVAPSPSAKLLTPLPKGEAVIADK